MGAAYHIQNVSAAFTAMRAMIARGAYSPTQTRLTYIRAPKVMFSGDYQLVGL